MPVDPKRLQSVFLAALAAKDRPAVLDHECAGDADLRQQVEMLIAAHDDSASLPGAADLTGAFTPITETVGAMIGPYVLREQIGEGGFGVVFVAEQTEPVRRKVALKLIKPGMDTRQVVARFEAERQALAMMDHPNIARVLDAGATSSGRPYFVMELVRGVPITEYCDKNLLAPKERLELFITVCQAIQHAHQKGIIHRDVKPSNVLVTSHDGKPVAKVIDFGVAKAVHQQLTDRSIYTNFATMVGTPLYMSPEQAEMSGLDIDTRSDIYSLGVLLYELLTGSTPLDRKKFAKAAYDEVRRLIREEEPLKPSTRLSTSESLASIAAQRHMEPAKLSKFMRGDLDWITMKALEKDRTRRYETANALARDIQRYLCDESVEASPPTATYRLRKFARKNRAALNTAAAIVLLLVAGIAVSSWQAVRASQAEQSARQSAGDAIAAQEAEAEQRRRAEANASLAKTEADKARQQAAETKAVLDFVEDRVFAAARPEGKEGGLGRDVTLMQAIDAAVPFVAQQFRNQPLTEARLRSTLGASYSYLDKPEKAETQLLRVRELVLAHLGPDHLETLKSTSNLSNCWEQLGRHAEALTRREATLKAIQDQQGPQHPDTVRALAARANSVYALGRFAEAKSLHEESLRLHQSKIGPDDPETLQVMNNLANSLSALDRTAESITLREETLRLQKTKLGNDHPDTLQTRSNLAAGYSKLGRHAEALALLEETFMLRKTKLGDDHADTLLSMKFLADIYSNLGRSGEALALREEFVKIAKVKHGPHHAETLGAMHDLANSFYYLRRHAEALDLREEVLKHRREHFAPDDRDTLASMTCLAASYLALGRRAEALTLNEETLKLQKVKPGPDHPETLATQTNLALTYRGLKREADARPLLEDSFERKLKVLPANHLFLFIAANHLVQCYGALDREADAVAVADRYLKHVSRSEGIDPGWRDSILGARMQVAAQSGDAAACRATAEMREKLNLADADDLYESARQHAVTAAVQAKTPGAESASLAHKDADRAMEWLHKAVKAGFKDASRLKNDRVLDSLRKREDFKAVLADLESKRGPKK